MANITDIKLPDNSQYDLKDNVSGYASKVLSATTDDLAKLTATGDLADSGKKLSDLVLKADVKDVLNSTSTTDPLSAKQGKVLADNLAANEKNGAKNLNSYPYYHGNRYTNGITFTDNGDGTVTATGTASADAMFAIHSPNITEQPIVKVLNGNYILTGCPSVSGCEIRLLQAAKNTGTIEILGSDTGDGATFTIDGGYYSDDYSVLGMRIYVANGTALPVGGITFKPMIRDARILDPTFVPYAETNLQLTHKTSGLSNENLLDNGWFTVNQRGITSGGFDTSYKMDRWQTFYTSNTSGAWSLSSSGLSIDTTNVLSGNNYFAQTFSVPLDTSKLYTASVMLSDGTVLSYVITSFPASLTAPFGSLYITATDFTITIGAGKTVTFRAVKLEIGSVSTLANDVEPNYTTELLKCQRYFYRFYVTANTTLLPMANRNTTDAYLTFDLPTELRAAPTVSYAGSFQIIEGANIINVSSLTLGMAGRTRASGSATCAGGLTAGYASMLGGTLGSYIDFSADL